MIDSMPRPRPPGLHKETTRHGKTVFYVRLGKGKRVRIRAAFGTPEFKAQCDAAMAGLPIPRPGAPRTGTLAWLLEQYRLSAAWNSLSKATRRQRENIFRHVIERAGSEPFSLITGKVIQAGVDRRAKTPSQARHFVEAMRGMFQWAIKADHVKTDPTTGRSVARTGGEGFEVWTADEIETFREKYPTGTRARVAFDVLYYTGLRRGDAVILGRQHVKNGVARLTTQKTGERVVIPLELELSATLERGPCGDLSFIAGERRKPMTKESFGNWFREVCIAAGIDKSAHGLRKAGATRDAERGWSESELEAKYGWRGGRMASHYTQAMNRERLAIQAAERTTKRTSIPAPEGKVRDGP